MHDKALIARRLKFAEIFVQMIAAACFAFASPALTEERFCEAVWISVLLTPASGCARASTKSLFRKSQAFWANARAPQPGVRPDVFAEQTVAVRRLGGGG